jgi:signal transduction histidine kinase
VKHQVRFDDRLVTVLNQPVGDRHDEAVRWRQLVELVARAGRNATSSIISEAIDAIRSGSADVDERVRAAAARAIAPLPLPFDLLRYFASDRLAVSAPVLAAATLNPSDWHTLAEEADAETRQFIETLHPSLKPEPKQPLHPQQVPPAAVFDRPARSVAPLVEDVVAAPVERRQPPALAEPQRQPEASERETPSDTALFRWECGPAGDIRWVEGAPRGALIGRSLAQPQSGEGHRVDPEISRAFALRAPFRDARISFLEGGALAGAWTVSGVPAFEPSDGRFAGYRGLAFREAPAPRVAAIDVTADPDSLRELVHEIRTPLNAIIGFAEIIDTQLLGPADEAYRARAAEIVSQARLLLNAIGDLDFVGKVHAAAARGEKPSADLRAVLERLAPSLRAIGEEHNVPVNGVGAVQDLTAAVEPSLAERLILRLWSSLVRHAEPGEHLRLTVDQRPDSVAVTINRPAALADADEQELFGEGSNATQSLELRLVRGLAAVAGGDVTAPPGALSLIFPRR